MSAHEKAYVAAQERRRACANWIKEFMKPGQPKPSTKDDLYAIAKVKLGINRSNFDAGWIMAIEEMGRQDWYRPAPKAAKSEQ